MKWSVGLGNGGDSTAVLTKDEFTVIVTGLKHYFPQENFIPTKQAMALWYERLNDIPYDILQAAVHMHVESSKFPPKVSELREKASMLSARMQVEFPPLEEVIGILAKATTNVNYGAEEEYKKLPKIVQKLVGSIDNFRSYGLVDHTQITQILENRIGKRYEELLSRERERYLYSPPIQELLAEVNDQVNEYKIEAKSNDDAVKLLPGEVARQKFENLDGYEAQTDDEYANELFARFGRTAPAKED